MSEVGAANLSVKQLDDAGVLAGSDDLIVAQGVTESRAKLSAIQTFIADINISNTEVAFGGTTNNILSSPNFTWDGTNIKENNLGLITIPEGSVIITKKSDFPPPIGGKINLVEATDYFINANIDIGTDNFVIPSSPTSTVNFLSFAFSSNSITYTGSGVMFEDSGIGLFNIFRVRLLNTGSGTLMNPTPSINPLAQVALVSCLIQGFASVGNWSIRSFIDECAFLNTGTLTMTDAPDFRMATIIMQNTSDSSGTFIVVAGTGASTGRMTGMTITTFAGETAFDINSGISSASLIRIEGSTILGLGTVFDPTGVDQKDIRVLASGNIGIPDSRNIGSMISQGNDEETVITTQGLGESNYVDLNLFEDTGAITSFSDNGSGGTCVVSVGHGLPDERLIEITGTISYNGKHEIHTVLGGSYDIDVPFVADDATGTWTTGGFADVDIERWELNDADNGELKYIGKEDFSGELFATISAIAVGGAAKRYKFRVVINGINGFAIPNDIKNDVTETTLRKGITVVTDDLVKIQVANFQDTSNIVIDTISMGIS